jgi:HEAT repeat protein
MFSSAPAAAIMATVAFSKLRNEKTEAEMRSVADFAAALHLSAKALQFYSSEHPRSQEAIRELEGAAGALLAGRNRVSLTAAKGTLLVDGEPLASDAAHVKRLAAELERRDVRGVNLMNGVTPRELMELARLLAQRPEQIKTSGGAEEVLRAAGVIHVRISRTRYELVTEGEEVVWAQPDGEHSPNAPNPTDALAGLLERYLLSQRVDGSGGGEAGSGNGDGGSTRAGNGEGGSETDARLVEDALLAALLAGDEEEPPALTMVARAREILRKVLDGMEPLAQLALLVSLDRLPPSRARDAFQVAAVELTATFGGSGAAGNDAITSLVGRLSQRTEDAVLLQERLTAMSVSREQLDEVLAIVTWEKLSFEERTDKLTASDQALSFPPEKIVQFIAELLENRRYLEVMRIVERYARGIDHQSIFIRHNVSDVLGQLTLFIKTPGLPRQAEQIIGTAILNHFVREREPQMKGRVAQAAANLIAMLTATGRCEPALRALTQLENAAAATPPGSQLRQFAAALEGALGEPFRAQEIIDQLVTADAETFNQMVLPLVEYLGGIMAPHAIDALGREEDRNRRGRLVRALKTIGEPAFPYLVSALNAPVWYVARNALNVLGDIGTGAHVAPIGRNLSHGDPRVRRAAIRALSKIGGEEAEALLASAIQDRDRETQNEVLLCLGTMKGSGAVPEILELIRSRRADDSIRELAVTTLGHIGSEAAIPALGDLLRSRSLLGREPAAIRIAAGAALAKINSRAARAVLQSALAIESDRTVKEALAESLSRSRNYATA